MRKYSCLNEKNTNNENSGQNGLGAYSVSKYFMLVILLKALDSGYWSHLRIHRQKNTPEVSGKAPQAVKKDKATD